MPPKANGENSVSLSQVSNLLNPQICVQAVITATGKELKELCPNNGGFN